MTKTIMLTDVEADLLQNVLTDANCDKSVFLNKIFYYLGDEENKIFEIFDEEMKIISNISDKIDAAFLN